MLSNLILVGVFSTGCKIRGQRIIISLARLVSNPRLSQQYSRIENSFEAIEIKYPLLFLPGFLSHVN